MDNKMTNIYFVILAAGKGTRMNEGRPSPIPKVLIPLGGKPMVSYILKTISNFQFLISNQNPDSNSQISKDMHIEKPILVIGYKGEMIRKEFGDRCDYVWQRQRLGTGHAAKLAVDYIANRGKRKKEKGKNDFSRKQDKNLVFILQGDDSAFYKPETLLKIIKNHIQKKAVLTFLTTRLPDVKDLGRVLRDKDGNVLGIIEKENMTPELEKIDEINCGAYLFNLDWGIEAVRQIKKHLKKGKEYPLPDIIKIALNDKRYAISHRVIAYEIPSAEWRGVNSPEQLEIAQAQLKIKSQKEKDKSTS